MAKTRTGRTKETHVFKKEGAEVQVEIVRRGADIVAVRITHQGGRNSEGAVVLDLIRACWNSDLTERELARRGKRMITIPSGEGETISYADLMNCVFAVLSLRGMTTDESPDSSSSQTQTHSSQTYNRMVLA